MATITLDDYRKFYSELVSSQCDEKIIKECEKHIWLMQQGLKPPPGWEWLARYTKPHPTLGYDKDVRWKVIYNEYGDAIGMTAGDWITSPSQPITPAPALNLLRFPPPPNEAISEPRRRFWHGTYAEYTATPEFARIAAAARKEWNYQCLVDANHKGRIEMHHRSYRNVPFGEDWRDLIPLCEDCHHLYHARLLQPPVGLFDDIAKAA